MISGNKKIICRIMIISSKKMINKIKKNNKKMSNKI